MSPKGIIGPRKQYLLTKSGCMQIHTACRLNLYRTFNYTRFAVYIDHNVNPIPRCSNVPLADVAEIRLV